MIFDLTQRKKVSHIFPVELLNQNVAVIDSVQKLGVAFDPAFSFEKHVSNMCRSAVCHICDLRRILVTIDQVRFQNLGPCSNHCIGCLFNRLPNLNCTLTYIALFMVLPYISSDFLHFKNRQ